MNTDFFEHQVCHLTARIFIQFKNQSTSIGTGFLYMRQVPNHLDRSAILLISNKHVFSDTTGKLQISFNEKLSNGEPDYGNIRNFQQDDFSTIYYEHPDMNVDLACVNISTIANTNIYFKNLHDSFLPPLNYESIPPGTNVIFVGYPENRFDVKNNLPIIRKGSIASLPQIDFNGRPQIVIDAQVFPGSSGSPVFVAEGGHYKLLGVVSETMIRHSQLQTIPAGHATYGVEQMLGLGIVIKQSKVIELIEHTLNLISEALTQEKT
jgi:hypothetical protein